MIITITIVIDIITLVVQFLIFFSVYKYGKEIKQNEERDNKNPPWN